MSMMFGDETQIVIILSSLPDSMSGFVIVVTSSSGPEGNDILKGFKTQC